MTSEHDGRAPVWREYRKVLESLERSSLQRQTRVQERTVPNQDPEAQRLISFCSNDYLGLSQHPQVIEAACEAAAKYGTGTGGSRLISGTLAIHEELERELASFKKQESALIFSSGYLANAGVVQALSTTADGTSIPVYFDELSHASFIDAVLQSYGRWKRFSHNDVCMLEDLLRKSAEQKSCTSPSALVFTEGVFSMDGDMAPLPELLKLCDQYNALLIVDDAHGTGCLAQGRGSVAAQGIKDNSRLIIMGTLSKALGSQGGFIAGPAIVREVLVNRARTFIYDTALSPMCAAAALQSLRLIQSDSSLVRALQQNCSTMAMVLSANSVATQTTDNLTFQTPIFPVIFGKADHALEAARKLEEAGYLAAAVRPPTVAEGTSRLRVTVSASHSEQQIRGLGQVLEQLHR